MKLTLEIGGGVERVLDLSLPRAELAAAHLHLASPEGRNRSAFYMRRHRIAGDDGVGPNAPLRSAQEPAKLPIAEHLDQMRQAGLIPATLPPPEGSIDPADEPALFAVPISDLTANLLRPAFHRDGLGGHRLFHFEGEPIGSMTYWCVCFFGPPPGRLEIRWVRFDAAADRASSPSGDDLLDAGLVWAAALVPLVVEGRPLAAAEIAPYDYDLRQVLGRDAEAAIEAAYRGWFGGWHEAVADAIRRHEAARAPFARFYHSALGLDRAGGLHVVQVETDLPGLAASLSAQGIVAAGLLDSGGSCAVYDGWLGGYLNHGWYFREPRGAVLVLETTLPQRLPREQPGSWVHQRRKG